jgi:hypothetical protein
MQSEELIFSTYMSRLQNQINSLATPRSLADSKTSIPSMPNIPPSLFASQVVNAVKISNQETRYQLHHGAEYREMLEPRDQVLEHSFDFQEEFKG